MASSSAQKTVEPAHKYKVGEFLVESSDNYIVQVISISFLEHDIPYYKSEVLNLHKILYCYEGSLRPYTSYPVAPVKPIMHVFPRRR